MASERSYDIEEGRPLPVLLPRDVNADTAEVRELGRGPCLPKGRGGAHEVGEAGEVATGVENEEHACALADEDSASGPRNSSSRYSEFKSIRELVEDTVASKAWRGKPLHASIELEGGQHPVAWKSGYIPKQLDRARPARSGRMSLRSSVSALPHKRRESVVKELHFGKSDQFSIETAIDKVHDGLNMVLGKQHKDMAALVRQIHHIKQFWQKKRPGARINTMADLLGDIKVFTESVQTQKKHYTSELSSLSQENERLHRKLAELREKEYFCEGRELEMKRELSSLASKLQTALSNEAELSEASRQLREENELAAKQIEQGLGGSESAGTCLKDLAQSVVTRMGRMQAEIEGLQDSKSQLESALEEQQSLLAKKQEELQAAVDMQQSEAMEMEGHFELVQELVKKIEDAETRMKEQANLCSSLQGQISHLKVDRENSLQAKDTMELMQEQWEDERAAFLEEIEQLKLASQAEEPQPFLSSLNEDFQANLLDLLQLLNNPKLLKENKALVTCLTKIRDNIFQTYAGIEGVENQGDGENTPSKKTFGQKVEYFQGVGSVLSSPYPAFNSPQVMEGIKARMNVEQKRQAKMNLELGEKISEATVALKDEFQKHISGYKARIDELERQVLMKSQLLHVRKEGGSGTPPLGSEETYDLSIFPEEWENALLSIITEAALCPDDQWGDMLLSKEGMMGEQHARHMERLMERLNFDFEDEVFEMNEAIAALESDIAGWQCIADQSPLDLEARLILQQKIIASMHRLQVLHQLASLGNLLVDPSNEVFSCISNGIKGISQVEATESDVDKLLHRSWMAALRGMKIVSARLTNSDTFQKNTKAAAARKQGGPVKSSVAKSKSSAIPSGGGFMNFSPGEPFLPGEREANLKVGQAPLKEVLGPKAPTRDDIRELKEELLEYFREDQDICKLVETIKPCKERHLEGSYKFGTKNIKLVILNDLLMVRIGGGFETFEQYFTKHFRLECFRLAKANG
ncbi:hypothetical protein A3770_06p43530 [Chloropicon primus]|uniref:GAR domain-containing protein n=3 Tax=Chloropicon primus TaxID=1764295 RepID=A0A5B8MQE8_9CHLO|nr:hypothetical protein A3770_06p43530 [Chloropicon primus]|eukprot:QDZ21835.1 hypothetical protein A3770_06p43530 [Chloropicon primus]